MMHVTLDFTHKFEMLVPYVLLCRPVLKIGLGIVVHVTGGFPVTNTFRIV